MSYETTKIWFGHAVINETGGIFIITKTIKRFYGLKAKVKAERLAKKLNEGCGL